MSVPLGKICSCASDFDFLNDDKVNSYLYIILGSFQAKKDIEEILEVLEVFENSLNPIKG